MTDLQALLGSSENPRTRELLRAGRNEAPSRGYSERLLVGLGLGVAASGVSVGASASVVGAASGGALHGVAAGSGAASVSALAAKWVAVGVIGGGILAGGAELAFSPQRAAPVASAAHQRALPPPQRPAPAKPGPGALAAPAEPEPVAAAEAPAELPKHDAAPAAEASGQPGQLGREVALIDRARRAMAAGELGRALNELNAFERSQSTGVLAREAKVLRIEALHRLGQKAQARQLAEQYSKIYPNDTHAARLRALDSGEE